MNSTEEHSNEKEYNEEWRDKEHHVTYEIAMFCELAEKLLVMNKENTNEDFIRNALVESFAVHERNIINFLSDKKIKDDVTYKTFLGDEEQPFISDYCDTCLTEKINKEILHLTEYRCEHEKTQWFVLPISSDLIEKIETFMEKIKTNTNFKEKYKERITNEINNFKDFCKNKINQEIPSLSTASTYTRDFQGRANIIIPENK